MTKKLKPCPFCGNEALIVDDDKKHYGVFIACSKCCSSTEIFKTEDEALIAWNARPFEDTLNEKVKKLERENHILHLDLAEIARGFDTDGFEYKREGMMRIAKEAIEEADEKQTTQSHPTDKHK